MKKLDLYILKKYFSAFFFVVFALVSIICVIDYTEKIDDYMEAGLNFGQVFLGYYIHVIPYMITTLSPITVFVSTILITAQMASHSEIIAILSSGISFVRFIWTYVMGAIVLGILMFVLLGWIIPNSNTQKVNFEITYLGENYKFDERNIHLKLNENDYAYMETYNTKQDVGYRFCLEKMNGHQLESKLSGYKIEWDSTQKHWHMGNYKLRTFIDSVETLSYGSDTTLSLNMFPRDFKNTFKRHETLTLPELGAYINDQKSRGLENIRIYEIERYERMTYPYAFIILTVMAVIVSSRKSREGVGMQIVLGLILAMVYIGFVMTGRSLAQSESMSPLISVLLPNVFFSGIAVYMYFKVPR